MRPEPNAQKLAEKLLLLTHLISSAVDEGQTGEVEALFAERQSVLDQLAGMPLDASSEALMELVTRAEKGLRQKIEDEMADSVRHMQALFHERRGIKAYGRQAA